MWTTETPRGFNTGEVMRKAMRVARTVGVGAVRAALQLDHTPHDTFASHGDHMARSVKPQPFEDGTSGQNWTPNVVLVNQDESEH